MLPAELGDFTDEVRRVFLELGRTFGPDALAGECVPPVDVYETDDAVHIALDLPGVEAASLRIVAKGQAVLIAGEKPSRRSRGEASFHLVERGFGRFARTVQLGRACDMANARATLVNGELRVTLPKLAERRGRAIEIRVTAPSM